MELDTNSIAVQFQRSGLRTCRFGRLLRIRRLKVLVARLFINKCDIVSIAIADQDQRSPIKIGDYCARLVIRGRRELPSFGMTERDIRTIQRESLIIRERVRACVIPE